MMGRIDEVRPDLEGLDYQPLLAECLHQAAGNGCFAAATMRTGNNNPGDAAGLFLILHHLWYCGIPRDLCPIGSMGFRLVPRSKRTGHFLKNTPHRVQDMVDQDMDIATLHLARWHTRFWAWLIDFILVSLVLNIISNPYHFIQGLFSLDVLGYTVRSLGFWIYWTAFEGVYGQSIGKMVMNIRVTTRTGKPLRVPAAVIESFGKSFILPFDCLIGWLGMPGMKLRLFNRISETIVVKTDYREPEGVRYIRENG
jgi:uncharacterized RDD family membrane protein YckC